MIRLHLVVLLAATAATLDIPCQEGVLIKTEPIKNADYMIGNWSYTYQWDIQNQFSINPIDETAGRPLICPGISIEAATSDFIQEKRKECDGPMPFRWEDAKLKMNIPSLLFKDTVIFMGEKNWLLKNCQTIAQIQLIKVSDEVMVLDDKTIGVLMLMSRTALRRTEMDCLVHNLDVGKHLYGFGLCH